MKFGGLLIIICLILILIVPPFQTPDEPAHLKYIQYIAENKILPSPSELRDAKELNDSKDILELANRAKTGLVARNPNYRFSTSVPLPEELEMISLYYVFNHPPLYYSVGALIYSLSGDLSLAQILLSLRVANIFLIALAGYYVYRLVRQISSDKSLQNAVMAVAMFWPMYLFISIGINSDALLVTASTATFVIIYELFTLSRVENKKLLELSFWILVGMLTKAQYFPILLVIGIVLLIQLLTRRLYWRQLPFLLPFTFLAVFYFINKRVVYGNFFPAAHLVGGPSQTLDLCANLSFVEYVKVLIYPRLGLIAQSFVGNFGWLDTKVPKELVFAVSALFVTGLLGVAIYLLRYIKGIVRRSQTQQIKNSNVFRLYILSIGSILSLETFYVYLYLKTYIPACYLYFPTQGRYYFPALLPFALILVLGTANLLPEKYRRGFYLTVSTLMITFNIYVITLIISRYYL